MANWSVLKVKLPSVPGYWKQRKSCPGFLPALMNSPLAQSPMICIAALPLMTIAVARFQSRFGKFGSTMPRTFCICSKAFSMVLLPSAVSSSSIIALR